MLTCLTRRRDMHNKEKQRSIVALAGTARHIAHCTLSIPLTLLINGSRDSVPDRSLIMISSGGYGEEAACCHAMLRVC